MRRLVALFATVALGLAGCVAGPDYHLPGTSAALSPRANRPFVGAGEAAFSQAAPPDRWWSLYDDPRLDGYVREALKANTDLRAADANLRLAAAVAREAKAARTVQTNLSAEGLAARVGGFTLPLPGAPLTYLLGFNASYPLDLAGGLRRGIEAASADSEAAQAARDQVRVVVAAAVTRSYAAACSANRTLAATQHVLDVQRETLDVTARLAQGGRGTAFDVTRARAAADQSAAAIPTILAQRQAALFELAALMGRAPADYPRDLEICAAPPEVGQAIPVGDGAQLIRRRPDIREAERRLAAATAEIGVQTAQLYPQVSLGGSAGFAGETKDFLAGSGFGASIGPLISWSFPNQSAVKARIAQANAGADGALAQFDGTVLQALRQTETALSAYAREADRNRALLRARGDAATASDQANRLFRYGRTGFIDVLTAEASLANAEAALAESRATLIDRQVDLFLALGGGWSPQPTASSVAQQIAHPPSP